MLMDNSSSTRSVENLAKALKEARENGQQVVPIVGAGLSADCGFPVITAVVRYFGKLSHYIQLHGPVYDYHNHKDLKHDVFYRHFSQYEVRPWEFLEDFGWPDWFQLNEDLFTKLDVTGRKEPVSRLIERAEREGLDRILPKLNPHGAEEYVKLRDRVAEILTKLQEQTSTERPELLEAIDDSCKAVGSRFLTNLSRSAQFDVIGDWRRLILYFTNFRSDHADALFARFGATRKPGQGHRFLAFLTKVLAVRSILTFNFDSLIEEALETEGVRYKVFAMERGAGLPYPNLLRDQLSVIKAHGSTHALLLDEQLDRPLSEEYLERFKRITGEDPVLLVVGCSAEDRRLRDLVSHVLDKSKQELSVAWLHYEQAPPLFLKNGEELRRGTRALPTNNPGATLLHLYSCLMNSNPASRVPYLAHVQQPVELAADSGQSNSPSSNGQPESQFDWIAVTGSKFFTASQILLKRANEWARQGYQFIWIDLESLHTFAGVIGSIIDQCRKYDPDLAPSLLPVDIDQIGGEVSGDGAFLTQVIEQATKRVARALRRARYYLAIDGLGTYAWPATTHHGLTHMAISRGAERRVKSMVTFLKTLEDYDLSESRVGVGVDRLTTRYKDLAVTDSSWFEDLFKKAERQRLEPEPNPVFDFAQHFSELRGDLPIYTLKNIPSELKGILATDSKEEIEECRALIAMVLFSLSCFRRTRPLVATTNLLEPLLGEAFTRHRLHEFLKVFTQGHNSLLQQLEGGAYWFNHSIRDEIYWKNTEHTGTTSMRKCLGLETGSSAEYRQGVVFQLFLSAITHQRISQIWYNDTFVQTRDTFAFLEYTYHRISSIRNLVKLRALALVGKESGNKEVAEDLVKGIAKCAELIRLLNENDPQFKRLGFGEEGPFADVLRNRPVDSSNSDWCDEASKLQESLGRRHRRQLHDLYRGWTGAELILRTQVPAEQLLYWCDNLLTDLVNHCNRLVLSYRNTSAKTRRQAVGPQFYNFGSKTAPNYFIDPELEKEGEDLQGFRWLLQDLQVKLWIERSDYETCIRHRRKHLWHSLRNTSTPTREDIENSQEVIGRCDIRQCHQLLNIANCKLKLQQELTSDEEGLRDAANNVLVLLKNIKRQLQHLTPKISGGPSPETNEHNEAWLRLLHLQAEAQIGHASVFSHDGFTGSPQHWNLQATDVTKALITIAQGLDEIGGRNLQGRASGTDAALYNQYRSLFYIFKGRTEWLRDPETSAEGLEKALLWFELARGGLATDSSLLAALIEIYVTEAFLARGRAILFQMKSGNEFHEALEMYDFARVTLRRARESLLVSHRHLMWQKLFFCITTQYHSDRLLLRYASLQKRALAQSDRSVEPQNRQYFEKNAREDLLRLRRAYQTLVSALDLYPPFSARRDPAHSNRFRWLYRMWWELTLCGYGTGRVVIKTLQEKNRDDDQAHDYVVQQLRWLNKADGVDESALKEVFEKNYDCLQGEYRSLENINDPDHLTTALNRRRKIIERANELSKQL